MLVENLKYDKRVFPHRFLNSECIPTVLFMQGTLQLLGPHGAITQYEYFGLFGIMLERVGLPLPGETSLK